MGFSINSFFKPKSVAVVGATPSEKKVGYAIMRNLVKHGYTGKIYPVNPKRDEILGIKVVKNLQNLPEAPELAILAVPPRACIEAVDTLGSMGTKAFLVISAGFKESGEEGKRLEKTLVETAHKYGARITGPNCLGIIDTHTPLNATFATVMPPTGNVAVVSQSGALLSAFLDWSIDEGVGFSKVISLGNQCDLDEADFIEFLGEDPETDVILVYMEGVADGTKLIEKIQKASSQKPILILKVGRTEAGSRASSSHTGSITGSDEAYTAAFRKGGAIRAKTMEDLFIAAKMFSRYRPAPVGNIAILTNAGGPGIMAADAIEEAGLKLASLKKETKEKLSRVLPPAAALNNPVDVIGDADASRYRNALKILSEAEEVDSILVLLTPQLMTEITETARTISRYKHQKPTICAFMGKHRVKEGVEILKSSGVPNYDFPEQAVEALRFTESYLKAKGGYPLRADVHVDQKQIDEARKILEKAKDQQKVLDEYIAMELVEAFGIPTPKRSLARNLDEAIKAADSIGYPVVLKISSPEILHKSDVGGVITDVKSPEELEKAFRELMARASKITEKIRGVMIEEMAPQGVDLIIGFKRDDTFGPVVIVGLGGIYVEILKDVAHGIAPISVIEATGMIRSLKSLPILEGARGRSAVNIPLLAETISRFSLLAQELTDLKEGEVNPLRATPQGIIALDARFIL